MARKPRIEYEGAFYHVITRGNRKQKIFNQRHTMYYNRRYKTVGHLFQGRYKAILCDRDRYLLALLKYIQYNPLRAKIAESLDQYPWSSHRAYFTKTEWSEFLDTDLVLRMFSRTKAEHENSTRCS
jgi:REP element-mobilizing transposase RayT